MREAFVAGRFYENTPKTLRAYIEASLHLAHENLQMAKQPSHMVLLPHAGHFYCGHVIAETLAYVELPKTLILLGPNHTGQGKPLALWYENTAEQSPEKNSEQAWQSPLGSVPIATDIAEALLHSNGGFEADTLAHAAEHSLEVLLPFLQCAVPNVHIVPIAISGQPLQSLQKAGEALGHTINHFAREGQEVGIVISSDMHHFSDHNTTMQLDDMALKAFATLNPEALGQTVMQNRISMCGVYPAMVALYAHNIHENAQEKVPVHLVRHTTSYEKGGDASRVVGYAGLFLPRRYTQKV